MYSGAKNWKVPTASASPACARRSVDSARRRKVEAEKWVGLGRLRVSTITRLIIYSHRTCPSARTRVVGVHDRQPDVAQLGLRGQVFEFLSFFETLKNPLKQLLSLKSPMSPSLASGVSRVRPRGSSCIPAGAGGGGAVASGAALAWHGSLLHTLIL